jgi:hypothetical protein
MPNGAAGIYGDGSYVDKADADTGMDGDSGGVLDIDETDESGFG